MLLAARPFFICCGAVVDPLSAEIPDLSADQAGVVAEE
ncbi:hypothetical protein FB99_18030 [Pantoea agglomerans]|nr:hypothetical protein FB99_18030 [Pantoea agglomerans]